VPPRAASSDALAVTAIGMVTPVGLDAKSSCASLRAGLSLMQELDYFSVENEWFQDNPVVGCPVTGVTDGMLGLGRWSKLGARGLEDLIAGAKLDAKDLAATGLFVALPTLDRPGVDARIATMLGRRFAEWLDVPSLETSTRVFPRGHAGAVEATMAARDALAQREITRAIVGGIDSLLEPDTLAYLLDKRRLKSEDQIDGLIPGEGAAFFALEPEREASRRGAEVLAVLDGAASAVEPITVWSDEASPATGLSQAIDDVFARLVDRGADTGLLIGDLNGETYRARELGLIAPRVLAHLRPGWKLWHPADCIGDTGAAAGAIAACMAARAFQRGYARVPRVLVFAGSDDGLRGALSLRPSAPRPST
jgi:3-oxoacyl-[acyl-carrier-protein] synthase-1